MTYKQLLIAFIILTIGFMLTVWFYQAINLVNLWLNLVGFAGIFISAVGMGHCLKKMESKTNGR